MVEVLPARYLSHFRAIHRGAYFAQLRTTTVRKLLPESWGFLCPVHTPDGAPCGLLSHLTATCRIVAAPPDNPEDVQHAVTAVSAKAFREVCLKGYLDGRHLQFLWRVGYQSLMA